MIRIIFFALLVVFIASSAYLILNRVNWHRSIPYAFLFLPTGLVAYYLDYQQTAMIASVAGLGFLFYGFLQKDDNVGAENENERT